ncbi:MAG: threonine synthase [Planctomycetes bacterium]|nr:threonine synthase [Planctomycetota bacterium]
MKPILSHLECAACGATGDAFAPATVCVKCNKPLLVRYDLERARAALRPDRLSGRRSDLWRYREVLPVCAENEIVSLGEGWTPLLAAPRLAARAGLRRVFIKEEGQNPTGSFKARGMAAAVSALVRLQIKNAYVPSAGNAAGALAAYGARAGINITIAMPRDTPEPNILECRAAGASVHLIEGLIGDCGKFLRERFAGARDAMELSTLREPYRVEGKKTMLYELYEQLQFDLPDVIIYPTGGGTGIVGMAKAYDEMTALRFAPPKRPRFVVVQSEGCAPIVRAFQSGATEAKPIANAQTIASGLRVPSAIGDFIILRALRESGGTALTVTDDEILREMGVATRDTGVLFSPEGAAASVAARTLAKNGWIAPDDRVVIFNTGSGLKYPEAARAAIEFK